MFGVIINSAQKSTEGFGAVRETAIIPTGSGEPRILHRLSAGRGVLGAWQDGLRPGSQYEYLVGKPVAVSITGNDRSDIEHRFPSTLLQKLTRAIKADNDLVATDEPVLDTIHKLSELAEHSPEQLGQYVLARGSQVAVPQAAPAAVAEAVAAVAAPVVREPALAGGVLYTSLVTPTKDSVEGYIERTLPGGVTETDVYEFARDNQQTVAIYGHAGTGKTSSARRIAAQWGVPFVQFECNAQVDEESVQGTFIPTGDPNAPLVWKYSELATAISQPSVILINESNRMPAKNAALFLGLLQERKLQVTRHRNEVIEVHPECLIVTDANPGYRGTQASDQAFLDRLNIPMVFEYDRTIEEQFIPSPTLLDLATQLRRESELEDKWGIPISTRLLKNFVLHARGLNIKFAIEAFVNSFPTEEERSALRILLEADSVNIASELGIN